MRKILLLKLILTNFQGITGELNTDGKNIDVFLANNMGKTRRHSAFNYLLFGKDSAGNSKFEIKNINATTGEHEHMLEHVVEGLFRLVNDIGEEEVSLRKVFHEKWSKKRGSIDRVFSGHTTEYFINSVPVQEQAFTEKVREIAGDESAFRLLTSPHAFPSLHWQKQRDILMEMCGDLTDADVINSMATLQNKADIFDLTNILNKHGLDNHKKVIAARRSEINKELEKIPVRISENQQMLPDVSGLDLKDINVGIAAYESTLNAKKLELSGINTGGRIAELSKELAGVNADIQKTQAAYREVNSQKAAALNSDIKDVQDQIRRSNGRIADIDNMLAIKKRRADAIEAELFILRGRWDDIDAETFQAGIATACAACGQSLPADKVQAARDKALAAFNNDKAERLKSTHAKGSSLAEEKNVIIESVITLTKERADIFLFMPGMEGKVVVLLEKQQAAIVDDHVFNLEYIALNDRKAVIESEIETERNSNTVNTEGINKSISEIEVMLSTAKLQADKFRQREQGEKRIAELKAQEKLLAAEFEKLERELYLMEQFTRTKCSLLTERINGLFETVKFKLFNELVNTGIEECCVLTVDGVPYGAGLGNSASIKAGLDVVRTLQRHYKLSAPVFIDNRESCTLIPALPCQVISLHVSPEDVVMRVETV